MPDRKDEQRLPRAGEHELHQEPPPPRADALDQANRRLSGTIDPEQTNSDLPEAEHEGEHADVEE